MNLKSICAPEMVNPLLDLGLQPISNRFLRDPDESEVMYPMKIGQCQETGIIQLTSPFPPNELVPQFDWITYSEPEEHLDTMVELLCNLPGVQDNSVIGAVSFKDDSTLSRFSDRGFKTWRLDIHDDLGIAEKGAGAESIQAELVPSKTGDIIANYGKADVLIVRHIFEHVYDLIDFTKALRNLTTEDGYILFEIPDCTKSLDKCDYTTLWEEHLFYFTPNTFQIALEMCGFTVIHLENYPYAMENCLVAIVQTKKHVKKTHIADQDLRTELLRGDKFAASFEGYRRDFQIFFSTYKDSHGEIALMGAGHLACTFICLFQLQEFIKFVVDDNPHKQGLFMPGSHLPIVPSSELVNNGISLCLLSLNPYSEEKVIANNQAFVSAGGRFLSIFPGSKYALHNSGLL
jgi:hypothetical protein